MNKNADTDKDYARSIIKQEGIGYAVCEYCDADTFKNDEKLRDLWKKAQDILYELEAYVFDD